MVHVLAFPDLKHVLPHWDVTSLNTHFLSSCFWFPLWIDWPAKNAAQRCELAEPNHCKLFQPTATQESNALPKLRNSTSSYRHLSFKHTRENETGIIKYSLLYLDVWVMKGILLNYFQEPLCNCANTCLPRWCLEDGHRCWKALCARLHAGNKRKR